jgi:hypothetical protein
MNNEELEKVQRYRDYPEGSAMKRHYDNVILPFKDYLQKYYGKKASNYIMSHKIKAWLTDKTFETTKNAYIQYIKRTSLLGDFEENTNSTMAYDELSSVWDNLISSTDAIKINSITSGIDYARITSDVTQKLTTYLNTELNKVKEEDTANVINKIKGQLSIAKQTDVKKLINDNYQLWLDEIKKEQLKN